ncbi:uncharacterized protein EAE98_009309 [Botrytis deweyae]|uniref:Uncharacterized protein n=2 Tax=Botrytis TaxID=33196 RepID=A0A4Z1K5X3_9HELO|nr:uncharacterized protein EAE98_009309 [Botrytis deweyae]KAF7915816.1 hypothetical protein EAE99_010067 [Botrytis elliptica]KAF7919469.1 hypothetical protein EAE98_009309 [Botrytis deweyae]TGO78882.1 hypothetical protein BELL_0051g00250 [Botrytis elliptica]
MGLRGRRHRSKSGEKKDKYREYSVYASECMLLPGYIEQSITLDEGTNETGRDIWKRSIRFEVDPKSVQRDSEHGHTYRGYSQSHRLGKTAPGELKSFKGIVRSIHDKMKEAIKNGHRFGKLEYISAVLEKALRKGSLLVHQSKLEVLENPSGRRTWQAQFIRLGARDTERKITKREKKHEKREVRRDERLDRINNSRVARGLGVQLSNNEKRSRKRHDRMRRPSRSDAESTGSWETGSSADSYYSDPSHGRRRRSSSRHYDGYTSGYDEDDSSDDESDTRSYASSGVSKPSRSSSYGSRSSVASGSGRSDSEYESRHRSGRYNNYPYDDRANNPYAYRSDDPYAYRANDPYAYRANDSYAYRADDPYRSS